MRSSSSGFIKLLFYLSVIWLLLIIVDLARFGGSTQSISYSQFLSDVDQRKIREVTIRGDVIEGTYKNVPKNKPNQFFAYKPNDPDLIRLLKQNGVTFTALPESNFLRNAFSWLLPILFFFGVLYFVGRVSQNARGGFLSMGKSKARIFAEKGLRTRFDDVAGVEEAKQELVEVVAFLKDPQRYSKLGGRMPKGILLVGPPGTGKTLLARAVAGEAGVPFFSINGSEFVELFVGLGAARVRDLFEQARSQSPCIVFIDELDALGKARGLSAITGSANDEKEQTLNQLLAELDGFDSSKGIILLAATNRPEVLDPALLRAGRFDRQILMDKPDRLGREKIIRVHLKNVKLQPDVSPEVLASITAGFSGADLANLVNEAALLATRRSADAIGIRDFTEAIERIIAGLERKTRLLSPAEKRRVAYHEMGHTVVALALGEGEMVHKVSIIPRGVGALGYTFRRPTEDRYLINRGELESKMAIALGGRAAESMFFSDISTGAADDLDKATEIARAMVTRYGMSEQVGLATFERDSSPLLGNQIPIRNFNFSEHTARLIDLEINSMITKALDSAMRTLVSYRALIEEGARILLNKETLEEAELLELWNKHHNDRKIVPIPQQRAI